MVTWISKEELDFVFPPGTHEFRNTPAQEAIFQSTVNMATSLLYQLTGEKFQGAGRTVTESYGMDTKSDSFSVTPHIVRGRVMHVPRGSSGNSVKRIRLRHTPATEISSITIQGRELSPSEYQLRNNAFVVRTNKTPWVFNGLDEIEISYIYGANPPQLGIEALVRLTNEFMFSIMDDSRCALPERVTAVTRQNLSMTVLDPQEFLEKGRVGIYLVDLFVSTYNPSRAKKKNRLVVPGQPYSERIN